MLTLELWVLLKDSISSLMTPEESQLSPRLRAMSLEESWLSLRLMALSLGESRHSLGVTKDELKCLKGYETGVSFQEVLRMIPHHPTENSKTEEKHFFSLFQVFSIIWNLFSIWDGKNFAICKWQKKSWKIRKTRIFQFKVGFFSQFNPSEWHFS